MPEWPVPQSHDAIWGFYEGDPTGAVPWAIWAAPMLYWAMFGLALFLAMVCLMVIVRRQWVEHERLAYPMIPAPVGHDRRRRARTSHQTPIPQRVDVAGVRHPVCPSFDQRFAQLLRGRSYRQHLASVACRYSAAWCRWV